MEFTGLSLAGLRSEVASGAGEGGQEGTGPPPLGPSGPGQEFGLPPEGTGEPRKGSEGGRDHFPPLPHLLTSRLKCRPRLHLSYSPTATGLGEDA